VVKLNRIYTKTGDDGTTGLVCGPRVPKFGPRVAALGDVDEANSLIGMARLETAGDPATDAMLERIQNDLFDLGADLATPDPALDGALRVTPAQVARLEAEIDAMNAELAPLTSFILPGGVPAAAALFLARAVVRRAERVLCALAAEDWVSEPAREYVNRLSDHLFVLARRLNAGTGEVLWTPGANR
jgi:cob(I)alamin adenosyltransferase